MSKKVCLIAKNGIKQGELSVYVAAALAEGSVPLAPQAISLCLKNSGDVTLANYTAFEYVAMADELWLCGDIVDDKMMMLRLYADQLGKPVVQKAPPDGA